ncbi:MAG: hypothetical protein RR623_09995 [Bacilli bacterium]
MLEEKINEIKKFIKKSHTVPILEIRLFNYKRANFFISLDLYKREGVYRLRLVNLDTADKKEIKKYLNSQVIEKETVGYIIKMFETNTIVGKNINKNIKENVVKIDTYIKNMTPGTNHFEFHRYLPEDLIFMVDFFIIVSKNLPAKLDEFFVQILAVITGEQYKFDYLNNVKFDLLKDNPNIILTDEVIEEGKKILDNVKYLEKVEITYYALVTGEKDSIVTIMEDGNKKFIMHCSCGCEYYCDHIYATLIKIKEGMENKFFKVTFNNERDDLLDKLTNNDYALAVGIKDGRIILINHFGELGYLPVLDENNKSCWKILEDNPEKELEKQIQNLIESNQQC